MMQGIIALAAGLAAWTALQAYYYHRICEKGIDKNKKTSIKIGIEMACRPSGIILFLAGAAGMSGCFFLAKHWGVPAAGCIRNELVFGWLVMVALIDGKEGIIPHGLTLPGFGAWVLLTLLALGMGGGSLKGLLIFSMGGCLMGGGLFFLCRILTKGGVGMGDVRVFGILGLLYGMNYTFSIVFFTILLMSLYGFGAVLCKRKDMKSRVPMGPFILASYGLCCLLGV